MKLGHVLLFLAVLAAACGDKPRPALDRLSTVEAELAPGPGEAPIGFQLELPSGYREEQSTPGRRSWRRSGRDPEISVTHTAIDDGGAAAFAKRVCYEGARIVTGESRGAGMLATCDHAEKAMIQVRYLDPSGLQCWVTFHAQSELEPPSETLIAQAENVCASVRVR